MAFDSKRSDVNYYELSSLLFSELTIVRAFKFLTRFSERQILVIKLNVGGRASIISSSRSSSYIFKGFQRNIINITKHPSAYYRGFVIRSFFQNCGPLFFLCTCNILCTTSHKNLVCDSSCHLIFFITKNDHIRQFLML